MLKWLSRLIDKASNYFASRKGLLPFIGIVLILVNFLIQFIFPGWVSDSNLLLHTGIVIAIFGLMLAWAL